MVEKLRRLISRGDIVAGERINELEIAAVFGVSRTPVREAIKLLASEGQLELLPGRGARVRRLPPEEIRDHFEVIGALERHAAERVAANIGPASLAELEDLQRQMHLAFDRGDRRNYFLANQKAHALLVRLAGSPTLSAAHETLTKRASADRHATLLSQERWTESLKEHADILAAIRQGDTGKAGAAALHHARRTGEAVAEIAGREAAA